ncbi:MAG: alanine--tRNA ligase [Syntrophales bacterium]|nr:alanine--tRNA ligase [Syntrophales bacterium]
MTVLTANEIRQKFLDYFRERDHTVVPSSSLVPREDPSLLFTNSGMVQFKNLFLGQEDRGYTRAVSSQKCVRAGGKHNDLESVGYTARHHTFFEMLGNFSFGDYFKVEAITWSWDFLTRVMGLPAGNLWITIYKDDDEAFGIWHKTVGIPADRIVRLGEKDNFWVMGDTGPCGPCSEILFDQGEALGCNEPSCGIECECGRYLEIWNLVFTQFDRDASGNLTPLPRPNIDTGMGLERLAAAIQGVPTNYDTDLFSDIITAVENLSGKSYGSDGDGDISIRVIADHARALTFLIADGVLPGNEGRGYVLRRILRRAARHGRLLGIDRPFLPDLVPVVIAGMGRVYPELLDKESFLRTVVTNEEQRFMETLDGGLRILNEEIERLGKAGERIIPGAVVFKLYDTFGFPLDLTEEAARSAGLTLDTEGFHAAMEAQRERARRSWQGSGEEAVSETYRRLALSGVSTEFVGYEGNCEASSRVIALLKRGEPVDELLEGDEGEVITERTPFYGEAGGQVGDVGVLEHENARFEVRATRKPLDTLFTHVGVVASGRVRVGETVLLKTERMLRRAIEANHSGTHILQAALVRILGDHVKQSGSLVNADRLRFDFTHFARIDGEELDRVETLANEYIRLNLPVTSEIMSRDDALKTGATAVFDEKYGDVVRLVRMGDLSAELCGGTHVSRTGDIGYMKILSDSSIAAGVRRIEAVTGGEAVRHGRRTEEILKRSAALLKTNPLELTARLEKLLAGQKELERECGVLKGKLAFRDTSGLAEDAEEIGGVPVLAATLEAPDVKTLREMGDRFRDRLGSGVLCLGSVIDGKAMLLCMVTRDLSGRFHAGDIIREIAPLVGGKGGGRPDMAQAGGSDPSGLGDALKRFKEIVAAAGNP